MYEPPPAKSAKPSIISQMPPKLRATKNSMTAIPPLLPNVTCAGECTSMMHSARKTIIDTMVDDMTCPMSPHQLTFRYRPMFSDIT